MRSKTMIAVIIILLIIALLFFAFLAAVCYVVIECNKEMDTIFDNELKYRDDKLHLTEVTHEYIQKNRCHAYDYMF